MIYGAVSSFVGCDLMVGNAMDGWMDGKGTRSQPGIMRRIEDYIYGSFKTSQLDRQEGPSFIARIASQFVLLNLLCDLSKAGLW